MFFQLVVAFWIFRGEDAHNTELTGRSNGRHKIVQSHVRVFDALIIVRLITHALAPLVSALAIGEIENLFNNGAL